MVRSTSLGLRGAGYVVGLQSLMNNQPVPYSAITTGNVVLRAISKGAFLQALDSDPALWRQIHELLALETAAELAQQISFRTESAQMRVLRLLREVPLANDANQAFRGLGLRHRDVAYLLSITPEHLARLLAGMRPMIAANSRPQRTPGESVSRLERLAS